MRRFTNASASDVFNTAVKLWREKLIASKAVVQRDIVDPLRMHQLASALRRPEAHGTKADFMYFQSKNNGPVEIDPRVPSGIVNHGGPSAADKVRKNTFAVPPAWHLALFPSLLVEQETPDIAKAEPGEFSNIDKHASDIYPPDDPLLIADDGYERRFSPPNPFVTRMWAGGMFQWVATNPLLAGQLVTQETSVTHVELKPNSSRGPLVLVTERRDVSNERGLAVSEDRQLVYMTHEGSVSVSQQRESHEAHISTNNAGDFLDDNTTRRKLVPPPVAPEEADFSRTVVPSEVMLFRYSAVTWNSHLIHYSQPYAVHSEGYPDIIVHGPLTCTLLLDALRRELQDGKWGGHGTRSKRGETQPRRITSFDYRAVAPLYVSDVIVLRGQFTPDRSRVLLWAEDQRGSLAMRGIADLD